jgi:hypothetical protein
MQSRSKIPKYINIDIINQFDYRVYKSPSGKVFTQNMTIWLTNKYMYRHLYLDAPSVTTA